MPDRHERVRGDRYYDFIDQFYFKLQNATLPKLYLHWEDFGRLILLTSLKNIGKQIQPLTLISKELVLPRYRIFGALDVGEKLTDQKFISAMVVGLLVQGLLLVSFVKWLVKVYLKKAYKRLTLWSTKQGPLLFDDMDDLTCITKPFAKNVLIS